MARFQTKPISGARDFLPLDVLRRQYVIGVIERVYQSYGFEPLDTPVMERLDTLLGKYGEEGESTDLPRRQAGRQAATGAR